MKKMQTLLILSLILNLFLAAVFALAAYRYRHEISKKLTSRKTYTVVMFGNSLTSHGNWTRELNRNDVRNAGTAGYNTYNLLQAVDKHVIRHKPKICFVEGGINDLGLGVPVEDIAKNFRLIVDKLQKNNIEPVLQSTLYVHYPWKITNKTTNAQVDSLNNFLSNLAIEKNINFLDLNIRLTENGLLKKEYHVDGLHLNEKAYKIWAEEVNKVLKTKGY